MAPGGRRAATPLRRALGRMRITTATADADARRRDARPAQLRQPSVAGRRPAVSVRPLVVVFVFVVVVVRFSVCTTKVSYFSSRPDLVKGGRTAYLY